MFKFDFYDFTAPIETGTQDTRADMTFAPLSFEATSTQSKGPIVAMQALGNDDDYAGDASTTGVLAVNGESVIVSNDFTNDIDWLSLSGLADGQSYQIASNTIDELILLDFYDSEGDLVFVGTNYYLGQNVALPNNNDIAFVSFSHDEFNEAAQSFEVSLITIEADDYSADIATTGQIQLGEGAITSRNDFNLDVDWIKITGLTEGTDFRFVPLAAESDNIVAVSLHGESGEYLGNLGSLFYGYVEITATSNTMFVGISYAYGAPDATFELQRLPDDFGSDVNTEGVLEVGGPAVTVVGNEPNDSDWLQLTGVDPTQELTLTFTAEYSEDIIQIIIRDSEGQHTGVEHLLLNGLNTPLTVTVPAGIDAAYVSTLIASEETIQIRSSQDDYSNFTPTNGRITVDGPSLTVVKNSEGDRDVIFVSVEKNKSYRILTEDGLPLNSTVYSYEDFFSTVSEIENYNSATGIFFVENNSFYTDFAIAIDHGAAESRTFRVVELEDDHIGGPATDSTLELGTPLQGQFNFPQDEDWFAITIDEAGTYRAELRAPLLPNRFNLDIIDMFGNSVTNTQSRTASRIMQDYVFDTPGNYFVIAAAASASNSPFTPYDLSVSLTPIGTPNDDIINIDKVVGSLDAGAGDDVVTAGLGNMPSASFSGGEGFDSLDLTVEIYQQFDYRAAAFEVATLRAEDGTVLGRYKQDGTRDYYTQYDVDGSEPWSRQVTVEDNGADAPWQSKVFTYSDDGDLMSVNTNGGKNILTYDVDESETLWDLRSQTFDAENMEAWENVTNYYINVDGARVRTQITIEYDNGTVVDTRFILFGQNAGDTVKTLTDGGDNASWQSLVITTNNAGEVTQNIRTNDNGIVTRLTYDRDGEFDWATRAQNEDTADIFNWASTERLQNASGETMSFEIEYDNGVNVLNEYDLDAAYAWARKVTRTEADGDITEFYYDDDGLLYETVIA
jgi:hypothetical protein